MNFPQKKFDKIMNEMSKFNQSYEELKEKPKFVYSSSISEAESMLNNFLISFHTNFESCDISTLDKISQKIRLEQKKLWICFIEYTISQFKYQLPFSIFLTPEIRKEKQALKKKGIKLIKDVKEYRNSQEKILDYYIKIENFIDRLGGLGSKWIIGGSITVWLTILGALISFVNQPYSELYRNLSFFGLLFGLTLICCFLTIFLAKRSRIKFLHKNFFNFMLVIVMIIIFVISVSLSTVETIDGIVSISLFPIQIGMIIIMIIVGIYYGIKIKRFTKVNARRNDFNFLTNEIINEISNF